MTGDGIFLIRDDGDGMVEMQVEPYASEAHLQELLAAYPALLPGAQMTPGEPRRWLLIGREVGVPGAEAGADQWSIDNLFVDQDATPTIVEVKRSTDTRIRREVVGQMLDYAANGVRYWPIDRLRERFEQSSGHPEAALRECIGTDGDVDGFWQRVDANLRAGRIRMIFVADSIPPQLQRIVEFLNEQMRSAEVLAVELKHYRGEGVRTLVPRLLGATAAAQQVKGARDRRTFEEVLASAPPEVVELDRLVQACGLELDLNVTQTPRARQLREVGVGTLVQVYIESPYIELFLTPLSQAGLVSEVEEIARVLEQIAGRKLTRKSPGLQGDALVAQWLRFEKDVLPQYLRARRIAAAMSIQPGDASPA